VKIREMILGALEERIREGPGRWDAPDNNQLEIDRIGEGGEEKKKGLSLSAPSFWCFRHTTWFREGEG